MQLLSFQYITHTTSSQIALELIVITYTNYITATVFNLICEAGDLQTTTATCIGFTPFCTILLLCSIQLDSIKIPTSSITTSAEKGLTLQASGISVEVTADWSYEFDSL